MRNSIFFQVFPNLRYLKRHQLTQHEGVKYGYNCKRCAYRFDHIDALNAHNAEIHGGIRDFQCSACDRSFHNECDLKKHVSSAHEGVKEYKHKCDECGKAFSKISSLKRHIDTVHRGLKSFQCNHCKF